MDVVLEVDRLTQDEARARQLLAQVEAGELTLEDDVDPEGGGSEE